MRIIGLKIPLTFFQMDRYNFTSDEDAQQFERAFFPARLRKIHCFPPEKLAILGEAGNVAYYLVVAFFDDSCPRLGGQ